ncbi:polysaccharide biosynthesis tyrosine autokinase [bacterium]|nr:MAG: polysaccharide biosynthesis tyrosine autokinase [bacterium]
MELTRYLRVIRQRLWMIVVCPLVAAAAAGIVSYMLPPVYEAHVSLYVRPAQPITSTDPTTAALTSDQVLRTYADWMTQRPILDSVDSELGLGLRYEDLLKKIKVTPQPNTLLLDVAVKDTNPAVARDIANQLVSDFTDTVKRTQAQAAQVSTADNLVVTSPAVLPDRPVSPNKTLNIAVAFAAGLLLAIGLAFLLDYLDQSVKSDEDLTERSGLVAIGHIAYQAAGTGKRGELVTLVDQSPAAEAYKALRTSLLYSTIDQELKEIVITSAGAGEGKSRTAANLAVALAHSGYKTLLIDADFRRPSQHRIFGRIRNVGLTNLIVQDVGEEEAVTPVDSVANLWLLTSGPTPPNPSEMLGSARMRELMDRLRSFFNYVIVDTPPVNAVTDALILAAFANGTIVVVEQGRTTFPALRHAKQMLDRVGARTAGAVMNKVRASAGSYAYTYGYYTTPANGRAASNGSMASEPEPASTQVKTS